MLHPKIGFELLLNENRYIEKDGERIALVGVENWGKGFNKAGDLQLASKGVQQEDFKILLSHDPSHWRAQVLPQFKKIDAMFAGHTHGAQFGVELGNFRWSPVKMMYDEWADLYNEGNQYLYVNRGFGYLGYPGRFGILPEITVFELRTA